MFAALRERVACVGPRTRVDEWYHALTGWQQMAALGTAVAVALWGPARYPAVGAPLDALLVVAVPLLVFALLSWTLATLQGRRGDD
jgi:hypothetical protein